MSYSEQVKQDARKAADYIREHGWCQGEYETAIGQCCASGAITAAYTGGPNDVVSDDEWSRFLSLSNAFKEEAGCEGIVAFNDTPGRTKEEVLAVFDKIANS